MYSSTITNSSSHLVVAGSDYEFIHAIIKENKLHDAQLNINGWKEFRQFSSFTSTMIWAFPVSQLMRWKIRRNKRLKHILQFDELIPVRNNIEKGSFAYDSLLFREGLLSLLKNKSHLANLVCLAILFGDEFIDGVAVAYGKRETALLLHDPLYNFNLEYKKNKEDKFEIYYQFDICQLLPEGVLNTTNSKYNISYSDFYQHLLFLLNEMNNQLSGLPQETAEESAKLICKVCNLCFSTYKEDITGFNGDYSFDELMRYQKSKDDDIIMTLLSLRSVLLNKKTLHYQKQFSAWSSMVRCMQLYDDMEDAAADCDFQMNMCCWFAKNYFPGEWQWLQLNKEQLKNARGTRLNASIALNMPGSCMLVREYAKNICTSKLNWVQQKIINYLWRKNWLGFGNSSRKDFSIEDISAVNSTSPAIQIHYIFQKVNEVVHPLVTDEMKKAWSIDIALMDNRLKKYIAKKISYKENYYLLNHFLEWDSTKKSTLIPKILA